MVIHTSPDSRNSPVPSGRLSRLARLGSMATGVAGSMLMEGARQLAQGKRSKLSDLLLTPANALRITHQLAQMRGAAMKVGQLISMYAGDLYLLAARLKARVNVRQLLLEDHPLASA